MTSMISSNKIMMRERLMNHMKGGFKTITCGSILQLTGKNGLDLKKIHNEKCEMTERIKWSLSKAAAAV